MVSAVMVSTVGVSCEGNTGSTSMEGLGWAWAAGHDDQGHSQGGSVQEVRVSKGQHWQ